MQDETGGNLDEAQWKVIVGTADSEPKDEKLTLDEYKTWMEKNRSPGIDRGAQGDLDLNRDGNLDKVDM